jgi:hypothetical protein
MLVQHVLDLTWPDLVAADVDLVLLPVDDVEPARLVHVADVAGVQRATRQRRLRLGRLVPVPRDHLRAAGHQLADLARWQITAIIGDDPHDGVVHRDADRQRARGLVDRRLRAERHRVRGRGGLGQAVDVVDVVAERGLERLDRAGRDRRAARVDLDQAGQGVPVGIRHVHQGDEDGDRTDGEGSPFGLDGLDGQRRVEPVQQHQRRPGQQADGHVPDQPGDVEQRGHAEDHVARSDADPVPVGLGVEHHVAVRGHGAFRWPGGTRGVGQEGHVLRAEPHGRRPLTGEPVHELQQIQGPFAADPLDPGEHARVIPGLEVQFRGGDDGLHVGARDDLGRHVPVQALQGDQDPGAGILEQQLQLPFPVHRVDRDRDAPSLPGAELSDHELGHVLQVQGHPVASLEAFREQGRRERIGERVQLGEGDPAVEVTDRVRVRLARRGGAEHSHRVVILDADPGRLAGSVPGQPGLVVVDAHT